MSPKLVSSMISKLQYKRSSNLSSLRGLSENQNVLSQYTMPLIQMAIGNHKEKLKCLQGGW